MIYTYIEECLILGAGRAYYFPEVSDSLFGEVTFDWSLDLALPSKSLWPAARSGIPLVKSAWPAVFHQVGILRNESG